MPSTMNPAIGAAPRRATECFDPFTREVSEGLKPRAPGWPPARYGGQRGGRRLRPPLAYDGCALRRRPHAPHRIPRGPERRNGRQWGARLRRQRVPEVSPLRSARSRLRPRTMRGLCVRAADPVLVQGPRDLSELRGAADDRARGAPRRPRAARRRPRPPVGALGSAPAPVPARLRPPPLSHGAARLRARAPQRVPPSCPESRLAGWRDRHGDERERFGGG